MKNSLGSSAVILTKLVHFEENRRLSNLRSDQLDMSFHEEKLPTASARLKEDNPLDLSDEFSKLCLACRAGDLRSCQELIRNGVNINARDQFDYTPLLLVNPTSAIFFI